jgi:hypothetical protein
MNKTRKNVILGSGIALTLALAGIGITHAASATTSSNPMSSLVSAIAAKFNLDTVDVQAVFDEQRANMEKGRQQMEADRLKQAVADGKLTQEQADKIIAKKAELEALHLSLEGKPEERDTLKAQMDTLKQWASDNNIPMEYIMFGGHGRGPGMRGHDGDHFIAPPTDALAN